MKIALYAGSFDPPTKGHIDIILRATHIFDRVIVVISSNMRKKTFFSTHERIQLINDSLQDASITDIHVDVTNLKDRLLVDFAKEMKAKYLIRGIRATSDFEYEFLWTGVNQQLNKDLDIVLFPAKLNYQFIRSSIVREVFSLGGDVSSFVYPCVIKALQEKIKQ